MLLSIVAHVHIKPLHFDVLLGKTISELWQVIEQNVASGGGLSLQVGGHYTIADRNFEPHRAQLRRAESELHLAALVTDRLEGAGDALHQPHSFQLADVATVA